MRNSSLPLLSRKRQQASGPRAWNSTFNASSKPLKQKNPAKVAKRRKAYTKKLAAYRRSEAFKVVEQRAAGRCEFTVIHSYQEFDSCGYPHRVKDPIRCDETEGLEHHHKRYGKQFGGNERPEDVQVLCKTHHRYLESQKPVHRSRS